MNGQCRICHESLPEPFFNLGAQTLANNLEHTHEMALRAPRYLLALTRCKRCQLVQLTRVVDPDILFRNYLYSPGVSKSFHKHFEELATHVIELLDLQHTPFPPLAVDIGSNDGTLLGKFLNRGWDVVGVEPSGKQAAEATAAGVPTLHDYWNEHSRRQIQSNRGKADLITATNVFAHVDNVADFVAQAHELLNPGGVLVIEVPYLPTMVEDGSFDLIYHEHLSYFHIAPLQWLMAAMHMKIVRVEYVDIHGGSIRVFAQRSDSVRVVHPAQLEALAAKERAVVRALDLDNFAKRCRERRAEVQEAINSRAAKGCVVGYTAPAKATVLVNFCDLTARNIRYIVDDAPLKQERYLPGSAIPIVPSARMEIDPPDTIIVFAWNIVGDVLDRLPSNAEVVTVMPDFKQHRPAKVLAAT